VKRITSWLALLLLLHIVVHPLLHVDALQAMASGPNTLSAAVAGHQSQSHDCELCRTFNSIAPTAEFAPPTAFAFSSPFPIGQRSAAFGADHSEVAARAPPTC